MKDYIKKFNTLLSVNNYDIVDIPFTSTVGIGEGTFKNLVCNAENQRIIVKDNNIDIFTIITDAWNPNLTDKTAGVMMSGNVILNGKTDCHAILFEDENSHLTINAGARLRVWEGGIVNNDCTTVNYLTIVKNSVDNISGEFLLHPNLTINTHPKATLELHTYGYRVDSSHLMWERFAIPTYNTVQHIECTTQDMATAIYWWSDTGWANLGILTNDSFANISSLNKSFWCYQLLPNSTTQGKVYHITGNLIGNDNATMVLNVVDDMPWANSYAASIKTQALLDRLPEGAPKIHMRSHVPGSTFVEITQENIADFPYITSFDGSITVYNSTQSVISTTFNYKDLVWDPSFEEVTSTRSLSGVLTTTKPTEIDTALEYNEAFSDPESPFPSEHNER